MQIRAPLTDDLVAQLRAGERVLISGTLYVARDAAHQRLVAALRAHEPLPFDPKGQLLYYMGPSPARPGRVIGAAGPTTSGRMDPYAVPLLEAGLKGMIGKGERSQAVREALQRFRAVYLAAVGGAGALIAQTIRAVEVIAYPDLGPEALLRLQVLDLPAIVVNDIYGGDAYQAGRAAYRKERSHVCP